MSVPPQPRAWWKSATIYQIYPVSFFDSNGDGIGDLPGILSKLDYLKDLGVDVLWLSPIYRSPNTDMGYDISDYRDIDPIYGTLEDWDRLLQGVHERGMKLMMDLVINHTSDEHAWFKESRAGKTDAKRDWYIWRPPRYDADGKRHPPNNWRSIFQGSAWEWDEGSKEYYLHLFLKGQPDLNWENSDVRKACWDVMMFWVDRGCDGFRMDVINMISKVAGFPDAPRVDPHDEFQPAFEYYVDGPRVHEFLKMMNKEVLSKHDLITVGETPLVYDLERVAQYVLPSSKELQMVFQMEHLGLDKAQGDAHDPLVWGPWKVSELGKVTAKLQKFKREEGFWNTVYIENHDQARSVSRFGNDSTPELRVLSAKLLALLQVSQSGTLFLYQGEEIGMRNFPISWGIEEYKDIATQNYWQKVLRERTSTGNVEEVDMSDVMAGLQRKARDHARTPIQWNAKPHAGFTTGTPWMRVNDDYADNWNVEAQVGKEESILTFWKRALAVRKSHDLLVYGDFTHLDPDHEQVIGYTRALGSSVALVLLNFSGQKVAYKLDGTLKTSGLKVLLGNYSQKPGMSLSEIVELREYEGVIFIKE